MTDITQHLPERSKTVDAIFARYKKIGDAEPQRGYLGASIIGHHCERYLWYTFRGCVKREFDGRMYRLFETGSKEEARLADDLRAIGCEVHTTDVNGQQFAVEAFGGHFTGHLDGCVLGLPEASKTWAVLEFKTHNAKSFTRLVKDGVKDAKPQHYAQSMVYMHLTGMTRALYMAVNKDTDDLYSERIRYDAAEAQSLMDRAERIITSISPPERITNKPDHYQCRWCDAQDICWGRPGSQPALPVLVLSCRQCCHATPLLDGAGGAWRCEKHKRGLSPIDQTKTCEDHLTLPGLLTFVDPIDYGKDADGHDYIQFQDDARNEWRHGREDGCFTSHELTRLSADQLVNRMVGTVKGLFGGTVTAASDDLLVRYMSARIVWTGDPSKLAEAWRDKYAENLFTLPQVARCTTPFYGAAEYDGERLAILFVGTTATIRHAEIREKVEHA